MQTRRTVIDRHFAIPTAGEKVILSAQVLQVFARFRQKEDAPEAGGLLFARFELQSVHVLEATEPNGTDRRWRTLFIPNRVRQRRIIVEKFAQGLHFVGEWHTHPEPRPTPSNLDLSSARESFRKSRHELNYFIMVIVGNDFARLNLWVSAHDGLSCSHLAECPAKTR